MALWDKILSRGNVEDRRSLGPVSIGGGLSLGGLALLLIFNLLTGGNPTDILGQLQNSPIDNQQQLDKRAFEGEDSYEVFASKVLGSNNDMWQSIFQNQNRNYTSPKLVLFRQATQSACGGATSDVGPHYCPLDKTIYIDETFFDELTKRFGAKGGDVAEAYVISHEVGHHAQNELGIMSMVEDSADKNDSIANDLSVRLELQADCFAGLWVNSIKDLEVLLPGEVSEAIDAAEAVGDDRIQKKVQGYINPETWTHGSSAQRKEWFNKGFYSGDVNQCNTY